MGLARLGCLAVGQINSTPEGSKYADWNNKLQMALEIPIGDLLGDKLLGASYNFHVNFVDRTNYSNQALFIDKLTLLDE